MSVSMPVSVLVPMPMPMSMSMCRPTGCSSSATPNDTHSYFISDKRYMLIVWRLGVRALKVCKDICLVSTTLGISVLLCHHGCLTLGLFCIHRHLGTVT